MDKIDLILQKIESLESGQQQMALKIDSLDEEQQSFKDTQQQILRKLEELDAGQRSLEIGQREINQIASSIRHRQEGTDTKIDTISVDLNKTHGKVVNVMQDLSTFRKETHDMHGLLDRHMKLIDEDLNKTMDRLKVVESRL